jgi:hypothetical protein
MTVSGDSVSITGCTTDVKNAEDSILYVMKDGGMGGGGGVIT